MTDIVKGNDNWNFIAFAGGMIMVDVGAFLVALAVSNLDIVKAVLAETGVITLMFGLLVFYVLFKD